MLWVITVHTRVVWPCLRELGNDGTSVIAAILVCTPPLREEVGLSGRALHREGQDEHHDLSPSIERYRKTRSCQPCAQRRTIYYRWKRTCSENVVVLHEPLWVACAQEPLGEPSDGEIEGAG